MIEGTPGEASIPPPPTCPACALGAEVPITQAGPGEPMGGLSLLVT